MKVVSSHVKLNSTDQIRIVTINFIFFTVTNIMDPLQVKCENIFLSTPCEEMRLQSDNGEIPFLLLKVPPSGNT